MLSYLEAKAEAMKDLEATNLKVGALVIDPRRPTLRYKVDGFGHVSNLATVKLVRVLKSGSTSFHGRREEPLFVVEKWAR